MPGKIFLPAGFKSVDYLIMSLRKGNLELFVTSIDALVRYIKTDDRGLINIFNVNLIKLKIINVSQHDACVSINYHNP